MKERPEHRQTSGELSDATWAHEEESSGDVDSGFSPGMVAARRFRIDAHIAAGGMGQVFKAHDLELDVPIALKTIRPAVAANPRYLRLFKQEVLLARSITHPNVCRIFDLWRDDVTGTSFLTMELLPGETLSSRISEDGALPVDTSLSLARHMADALDAAHRAGIVHRDFKSPNVMVVPDGNGVRAVVTDFGLAVTVEAGERSGKEEKEDRERGEEPDKELEEEPDKEPAEEPAEEPEGEPDERGGGQVESDSGLDSEETIESGPSVGPAAAETGIVGTPAYMSPEQIEGSRVGPATDLYAFGVVLFQMCTGQLPFRSGSLRELTSQHLNEAPPRPGDLVEIGTTWDKTILRLLAKKPEDRFATATDAILELEGRALSSPTVRHSLPAERDAFVGRDDELRSLAESLEGNSEAGLRPLVTLLGIGGTGKTRLTQKYGWDSLLRWSGGVWFCDVSEARTALGVAAAVATSLSVPLGRQDPVDQLGHAIAGRGNCLVILDNFEQVVDCADETVGRWIELAPKARFLVTSRQRLQLPTETVVELEPLDPMTRGVELFEARAWGHRPGFLVDPSNRNLIQEIVKKLDGLPLAIEMAASRLRGLSPSQLEAGLSDRFRILEGGKEGRHATMKATLDWSWDLLLPWEQSAIAQISVFEGGFDLEAAESVVELGHHEGDRLVLDVIQSLIDKSWLRAKAELGAPRFEVYRTVQEYAAGRLREESAARPRASDISDASDTRSPLVTLVEVEARHGRHYARMGTADALQSLNRHGGVARRAALDLELTNQVVACRRALARGDHETAAATYLAAAMVLRGRGPFLVSWELGREVLETTTESNLRARVLPALATIAMILGYMEESEAYFEEAIALHREQGDSSEVARVQANLGTVLRVQGRFDEAVELYEKSLAIHRQKRDLHGEGIVLGNLGNFYFEQGRNTEALETLKATVDVTREVGDQMTEAMTVGNLGLVHQALGRVDLARECFETSSVLSREVANRRGEGMALTNLGNLLLDEGRPAEALTCYEAAEVIQREIGDRASVGVIVGNIGLLHSGQGRPQKALEALESALSIHRAVSNRRFVGITLGWLGALHVDQDRLDPAKECLDEALSIHREMLNRTYEALVLGGLGALYCKLGRMDESRRHYEQSIALHRELGDPLTLGKALCEAAEFRIQDGESKAASEALEEAVAIEAELGLGPESELAAAIGRIRRVLRDAEGQS